MKYAADFRSIARDALKGRWTIAVIAGLLASLLGALSSSGPEVTFRFEENHIQTDFSVFNQPIFSTGDELNSGIAAFLVGSAVVIMIVALVMAVLFFILGSIVKVGYSQFNLELVDRQKEPELGTLFGHFKNWSTPVAAAFLQALYVFLWTLLLIIPGIIAGYSYAMTEYILAEHPEMTASEAIARSKEMMAGNRWRLFCLQISFIGWEILCMFTMGIGNLWLIPYKQAATAAFYREISGTWHTIVSAPLPEEPWQN